MQAIRLVPVIVAVRNHFSKAKRRGFDISILPLDLKFLYAMKLWQLLHTVFSPIKAAFHQYISDPKEQSDVINM